MVFLLFKNAGPEHPAQFARRPIAISYLIVSCVSGNGLGGGLSIQDENLRRKAVQSSASYLLWADIEEWIDEMERGEYESLEFH
ncbi:hypothetical protein BDV59DRAFT_166812 [Aspergillus ambiguus]|uniref:uncharacterized protein n=1 Tax=Aspergillus ambiguus TaxID=176160 RepID=UPI003CCD68B1